MLKKIFLVIIFLNVSLFASSVEEDVVKVGEDFSAAEEAESVIYLTLEEVCDLALNNNFDIQLAQFDARFKQADLDNAESIYDLVIKAEAKFNQDQTKSASSLASTKSETRDYNLGLSQKLPTGTTLEADFNNQRAWSDSAFATINPAYESRAKLTLKQELGKNFFGISDRAEVKIAKLDIENAQYTSLDKIEETLSEVQKSYWRIAQYLNVVRIRQGMLNQAEELFEINQEKIRKGIIETPQLIASEANLRQKEIDLILAQNELDFHINQLKLLLNLEDRDKIILSRDKLELTDQSIQLSQVLNAAFQQRRDYLAAKNEIDSKNIKLVMKKTSLWPEINLEASVARNGLRNHFSQAIEDISSEDNPEYFLGLSVEFPLQNRQAKSEFNKAKIEKAKALINLKKVERQILIEIQDKVRNCNILEQRAIKQENVVELQEKKLTAELKRYQYGRSDTDTVIRYQDDLLSSQILYAQALLDYQQALIELSLKENSLLNRFWKDSL